MDLRVFKSVAKIIEFSNFGNPTASYFGARFVTVFFISLISIRQLL